MARSLARASDQWLRTDTAPVTATPFTIAGWFRPADLTTADQVLFWLGDSGASDQYSEVYITSTGSLRIAASNAGAGFNAINHSASLTANVWQHFALVVASATSRTLYVNGIDPQSDTANCPAININRFAIGRFGGTTFSAPFNGNAAEVGVWNVSLTAAEIASLGRQLNPIRVQPANMRAYYPLLAQSGDSANLRAGGVLTAVNTPGIAEHPPVAPLFSAAVAQSGLATGGGSSSFVSASASFVTAAVLTMGGSSRSSWRVPTNAAPGTSVHVMVFTGTAPNYVLAVQGAAVVDASGFASINGAGTPGDQRFAVVHNYNDNPATVSIFGGPGVATLT